MMPASTTMGGMCMGMPDVCKVPAPPAPPIPIPFPNIAQLPMAVSTSTKVMIMNMPAVVQNSQIPLSSGDEAGVAGGVVSGMNMGPVVFKMGSSKVKIEGKPACTLTSMTAHNGSNANFPAGAQIAPSQTKVLVAL
jgi:hypothetical protein